MYFLLLTIPDQNTELPKNTEGRERKPTAEAVNIAQLSEWCKTILCKCKNG